MPTPTQTFEGMNQADGCGNCIPPDPNGAVGPNHYTEMVNSSFAIYSKTGTKLAGPTHINLLWSALPGPCKDFNDGDPVVLYDHLADRWVLTQFAVNGGNGPFHECVAVSQTNDPTGSYYVYDFGLSDTVFHDYPHLGVWPDAYYMTTNQFGGAGQTFIGAGAFAFERDKMLLGQPARMVFFDESTVNSSFGGMLPSYLDGPPPPLGSPIILPRWIPSQILPRSAQMPCASGNFMSIGRTRPTQRLASMVSPTSSCPSRPGIRRSASNLRARAFHKWAARLNWT